MVDESPAAAAREALIENALFPFVAASRDRMRANRQRFVHYTTAEVAFRIIEGRTMWMRNARTMNDFSEIEYGSSLLDHAWSTAAGKELCDALHSIHTDIHVEIKDLFGRLNSTLRNDTFLACFSEHLGFEDPYGRLSMWRAYGGENGVALVFKSEPFFTPTGTLNIYASPVGYWAPEKVVSYISLLAGNIRGAGELLSKMPKADLVHAIWTTLRFLALCTKHPGFAEEREWRVIHSPEVDGRSPHLQFGIELIRGIPQTVVKVPLRNVEGLSGIEVSEFLDQIIIGPSQYPYPMFDAFVRVLRAAGLDHPEARVRVSDIPLRR